MKRLFYVFILFWAILFMNTPTHAIDNLFGTGDLPSSVFGVPEPSELFGVATEYTCCAPYYANAILSINFENGLNACDTTGNAVAFTDNNSDIGAYGEGDNQAMKCDDSGEYIYMTQTAGQYFDATASQTICMKVYVSAGPDNDPRITIMMDSEGNDYVYVQIRDGVEGTMQGHYITESGSAHATGSPMDVAAHKIIGYSWEGSGVESPNGEHAANPGDQATWADGWEQDADELDWAMTDRPTIIRIGTDTIDPGDTEYIIIEDWAIVTGYKVDCDALMNP